MGKLEDQHIIALITSPTQRDRGFTLLLDRYNDRLYWRVRHIVGVHEEADDVMQNVWIKVYKHMEQFNASSSLFTWLYRIASNEALSSLRKKRAKAHDAADFVESWASTLAADPYFDGDEATLKLHEAVMNLPPKQREVFLMRYFDDLSYDEMAELTNTSVGGLKASYHHAKKKIEEAILNINYR